MPTYISSVKEAMLSKLFTPGGPSVRELAKSSGISKTALYQWKQEATQKDPMKYDAATPPNRPQNWSAEAKLKAITETSNMSDDEVGAYCRKNGLYTHHLQEWKQALIEGLKSSPSKKNRQENQKLIQETKALKQELLRKDKALAEVSALLVLKKKADLIWGTVED